MPLLTPLSKCSVNIEGLGTLEGWHFENGVRQFCGIPYATLSKRWTRSVLSKCWKNRYHDGTKLGNDCPQPGPESEELDPLTPVPPLPHFNRPSVNESSALVMNIVLPPSCCRKRSPIFVYVHGGSLLYRGANLVIFDAVNLVSQSIAFGKPIIAVNFNYRVGIGCGNFGFEDQKIAFESIQEYLGQLEGDTSNVTAVGESAGGILISKQLIAKKSAKFHRAICMSGLAFSIPAWTMRQHEAYFRAICRHFSLDPLDPRIMDTLRKIPEQELADATPDIQGVPAGTGSPCIDSQFYLNDPLDFHPAPTWLESYMFGDVYHEGVIFHMNLVNDTHDFFQSTLLQHIGDSAVVKSILNLYDIHEDLQQDLLLKRFEHMCGDAIFKIPNYVTARCNKTLKSQGQLFLYHCGQLSRIPNVLQGTAYHAHDLLYLFQNLGDEMCEAERGMARGRGVDQFRTWPPALEVLGG